MSDFKKIKNNPIFITGFPKSGTTLLASLLDGHNQLSVFPEELKYFWKVLPTKNKLNTLLNETGLKNLQYNKFEYASGKRDYSDINFDKMKKFLYKKIDNNSSDKEIFLAVMEAYYDAKNFDKTQKKYWVEKTPLSEHYYPLLKKWFNENLTIIYISRNALDNFASYRKKRKGKLSIEQFALEYLFSHWLATKMKKDIANFLYITYEELVNYPQETLNKLCQFLKINFEKNLLIPTKNNKIWNGNSMHGKKFNTISNTSVGIYKKLLNQNEIQKLNNIQKGKNFYINSLLSKRKIFFKLHWSFPNIYDKLKKYEKNLHFCR